MCGIVAVLARRPARSRPAPRDLEASIAAALAAARASAKGADGSDDLGPLTAALATLAEAIDGIPGLETLAHETEGPALRESLIALCAEVDATLDGAVERLASIAPERIEAANAAIVAARDLAWRIGKDRVGAARRILDLCGDRTPTASALAGLWALDAALSCLDRIEVRGRDSAGVTVFVATPSIALDDPRLGSRRDPLLRSGSVHVQAHAEHSGEPVCAFTYKVAAEIGELGDNVRTLRDAIRADDVLFDALAGGPTGAAPRVTVLGHTRWASVGVISEPNAHPLDAGEVPAGQNFAVLNGDVDNHRTLLEHAGLAPPAAITTDAKTIPLLTSQRIERGDDPDEAFLATVASFEGSVAIASVLLGDPDTVRLALRGSGQALYVGAANDLFLVASEPYGVVEVCEQALRMDGETPGNPAAPVASRGQVVTLRRERAGDVEGIRRRAYDRTPLPVAESELRRVGLTTRDIDRRGFEHFLLKEIHDAPDSFQKTLRGRIRRTDDGGLRAELDESAVPARIRAALADRTIRRILVIGQGTAAVAGQAVARSLVDALADVRPELPVEALPATELSGFAMRSSMRDTLIVAISQSGTTTDTNRTVDLVRQRGALVLAIVNRRGSDLTDKADGVIYTSDGRDVEMSVASTKAFYAQVAAGALLAEFVADICAAGDATERTGNHAEARNARLAGLQRMPDAMRQVLERRETVAAAVHAADATRRRHWAVVGNGRNGVTAREIRIKLSELCYKSIACDATEDKKHIDLSSEPMILVCAAGTTGSTAADIGKEVAIFRAHHARPIVICTEGADAYTADAYATIPVPAVHPELDFVLGAVAGHLFGYEAARAIDALARPLRLVRSALEASIDPELPADAVLERLRPSLVEHGRTLLADLRAGRLDGCLESSTAIVLTGAWQAALGYQDLASFVAIEGAEAGSGTPAHVLERLAEGLSRAIDELTRPIDAIKHQAKTVTVGISRADEALLTAPLVTALLDAGLPREHLTFEDLRALAALDPMVREIEGYSRYRITGPVSGEATIERVASGGIAAKMSSRTDSDRRLRGTKHLVARERRLLVARGRSDGRNVVIVPEVSSVASSQESGPSVVGITLLHVALHDRVQAGIARAALTAYRSRYAAIRDLVTETESQMDDDRLAEIPSVDLLTQPIFELANRWRA
jgi:glucosamine--fructose-6-phosphate aminotransferase (isomerizing)